MVTLEGEYVRVLADVAASGAVGRMIYDAIIARRIEGKGTDHIHSQ
jgi:hypothetical protein